MNLWKSFWQLSRRSLEKRSVIRRECGQTWTRVRVRTLGNY